MCWHQKYFKFNFNLIFDLIEALSTLNDLEWRTQPYEVPCSGCAYVLCPCLCPVACGQRKRLCRWRPGVNYSYATCAPSCLLVTTSVTLFRTVRHRRCCRFCLCCQRLRRCLYIFNVDVDSAAYADGGVVVVVVVVALPTPKRLLLLVCFQFCCWWAAID